jgi:glutaredoxin 3
METIVYTKNDCRFCESAKLLLTIKQVSYKTVCIGEDISREEFIDMFPDQKSVPLIFIDEKKVGGYDDLKRYFDSH